MATALNLFPARIAFVNADGTLTPEAYRALQTLLARVGGPLGDNGVDVFGDLTGAASLDASITDTVTQQPEALTLTEMVMQLPTVETASVAPGSTATGVATLDFGVGSTDASLYVADANVSATSYVTAFVKPAATANNTALNHVFESLQVIAGTPASGGFTLYGKCATGLAHGQFVIGYTVN